MPLRSACVRLVPCFAWSLLALPLSAQATTQESLDPQGLWPTQNLGFAWSKSLDLTPDARWIVFESPADSLVAGDGNGVPDVFVRDRQSGAVERVSVGLGGVEANSISSLGSASADARWIAFRSAAFNLVASDTNGEWDVFVRDRVAGTTTRVSVDSLGAEADGGSDEPRISPDGRWVAFSSWASNLVAGDANLRRDVFLHDRQTGATERVNLDDSGLECDLESYDPDLTPDGRFVSFFTVATNLHASDGNGTWDVYVRDRQLGVTELASETPGGVAGNGPSQWASLSDDGRYVVFESAATDLVAGDTNGDPDVFVRDLVLDVTERVSVSSSEQQGFNGGRRGVITPDGRYVAFQSDSTNLFVPDVNGKTDIFLRDRTLGTTELVSYGAAGGQGNGVSLYPLVSADARFVSFDSYSNNLVVLEEPDVVNSDVYLRDRASTVAPMDRYCTPKTNSAGCAPLVGASGVLQTSGNDACFVFAEFVLADKNGIFFWGASPASIPFGGGTLCVQPPTVRTPVQESGGGPPCTGTFSFHFSQAYLAAHGLTAGATLYGQYWSRDPGFPPPQNVSLTDAIEIVVAP